MDYAYYNPVSLVLKDRGWLENAPDGKSRGSWKTWPVNRPCSAASRVRRFHATDGEIEQIIAASCATAILVTHDIDEALELTTRVVVLGGSPSHIVTTQVRGDIPAVDRGVLLTALGTLARVSRGV